MLNQFPWFKKRVDWFIENRLDLAERNIASMKKRGKGNRLLCALVSRERLERILKRLLDEDEFFSEYGIRSLSKYHNAHPYCVTSHGKQFEVAYQPGESDGNSNWRGPIWMTVNFLLIESLQRFYLFYSDQFQVECPTGSGEHMHLGHVAEELQHRLQHLFARTDEGRRTINAGNDMLDFGAHWKEQVVFHEHFDGDTGRGLGASHHCGSSSLIAKMIHDTGVTCRLPRTPRTPSVGLAHYFDDILARFGERHMRASSSRSITIAPALGDEEKADGVDGQGIDAERAEADAHIIKFVSEQLEKVKVGDPSEDLEDEIET